MKTYTAEEFLSYNGWSASKFIDHFSYFLKHKPDNYSYTIARTHMILRVMKDCQTMRIKVEPHCNGHSKNYLTFSMNKRELITVRNDVPPKVLFEMVTGYINSILCKRNV